MTPEIHEALKLLVDELRTLVMDLQDDHPQHQAQLRYVTHKCSNLINKLNQCPPVAN